MKAGTRIRMRPTTVWPERVGSEGVVVEAPNGPGVYPDDPRDKNRVIVLLDDDPLGTQRYDSEGSAWTCALSRGDVEEIT